MKWSEWLIKKSVSDFLFDPEASDMAEDVAAITELRGLCRRELDSPQSIRQLKAEVREFASAHTVSKRVRHIIDEVGIELAEILDDLRFASSPRGRFILFSNDYGQQLYKTIRPQPRFAEVYIGAHTDREAIMVTGHVPDETALQDLHAIIAADPPGVDVIWTATQGVPH